MVKTPRGFTLVELLVTLAIIATLLTWVGVRLNNKVDVAKEQTLRHNLQVLRSSIDAFRADRGDFPQALSDLVDKGYLRQLPVDPFTGRTDSWVLVYTTQTDLSGIEDIHSGADAQSLQGVPIAEW